MLWKLTIYDIKYQYKQGFFLVYGIISLLYVLILFNIPTNIRLETTAYFILSDTSVLGLTFVGALVLLEKQQNILQSLFVTPLKLTTYLWAKVLSLMLIALLVSSIIGFIPGGMAQNVLPALLSVVLCSMFFTLLGLGIAARVSSLNGYLAGTIVGGIVPSLPLVLFFYYPDLSIIFPINAAIDLLIMRPETLTITGIIADTAVLICWNIVAFLFAKKQFSKYVIKK